MGAGTSSTVYGMMTASEISSSGSFVSEKVVMAEVVGSLEDELEDDELDDDELDDNDLCRFLAEVAVGAGSLVGLLGVSVGGKMSVVAVEGGL